MERSCLACRALAALRVPGHRLPPCRSHGPVRVFSRPSCCRPSEGLFGQYFSVAPPIQHLEGSLAWSPFLLFCVSGTQRGPPGWGPTLYVGVSGAYRGALAGVLLCTWECQALTGAPWLGSYFVVQSVRRLMGQPLCCSAADAGIWEERGCDGGYSPNA